MGKVLVAVAVSVVVEAEDLKKTKSRSQIRRRARSVRRTARSCTNLRDEVQEGVPRERPHRQAHKQLQDERVGLLAGVEEDEADAEHGAQRDERDGGRAVAIFCPRHQHQVLLFEFVSES